MCVNQLLVFFHCYFLNILIQLQLLLVVRDLAQFPFFTETGYGMGEWILTLLNSVDMVEKGMLT